MTKKVKLPVIEDILGYEDKNHVLLLGKQINSTDNDKKVIFRPIPLFVVIQHWLAVDAMLMDHRTSYNIFFKVLETLEA